MSTTASMKILHLEDMFTDAELVEREINRAKIPFNKLVVDNRSDYIRALNVFKPDIVLSDHSLPSFNSFEALEILKDSGLNIPFILITATISEEFAVGVMKQGASDYVLKDRLQRLPNAILNALEKFRAEAERQRANQELTLLFNTIDEVFFSKDVANSRLLQISPACEKIFGYSQAEFLEDDLLYDQVVHPDDQHLHRENYEKYERGETVLFQFRIIRRDKQVRWVESKVIPALNDNSDLLKLYGVTRDITENKLKEEEIQRNAALLREAAETQAAILNALPPNIALLNEKGRIMAVNGSWKKFAISNNLGVPNYGIGYNYVTISEKATGVCTVDGEKIALGIRDVISGNKKEFIMEYPCHTPAEKRWFQVVVSPLADHTQKGAVVLHINITDRKLAEEQLRTSEANLRSVFENTDLAIVLFDNDLKVVAFNTNARKQSLKNLGKRMMAGATAAHYLPKERQPVIAHIMKRVHEGEMVAYEAVYDMADGSKGWFEVKWVGVINEQKETIGTVLTLKNITGRKIAELERNKMTADLLRRNSDLEQFTYIVSHNLRAPVANIMGLSNLLNTLEPNDPEMPESLKALALSISNLDRVIIDLNQILQGSNQLNDKVEMVSLPALVEEIRLDLDQMISNTRVSLTYNFNEVDELLMRRGYLYSIFQNLVINSIKFRRMYVDPVINITSRLAENRVLIHFKDNGKGIDLVKNGANLFGLYRRFDSSVEGKGMGLFIVKMQVESLGGKISVISKPNEGAEFILEFAL